MFPESQQDHFRFIAQIGSGSFGNCFLCERLADSTNVVLKKMALTEQARDEAIMLNQISHDNVVRIFESYMSQRSLYIVLEYMAGGSLHEYIHRQEEKPFKDKLIINYAWQLCSALAHIHQLRIVHRDVKPRNVVLSEDHKTLKLCDFGIAIQLEAGKKDKGSMRQIGTTNYMAPEILEGREYDCKVDVWALGCIVYEMVERKRAFPGTQELAVFHKICQGIVTYPEHSKLNDLIKKLLTKSIDSRPSSLEAIELLEHYKDTINNSSSSLKLLNFWPIKKAGTSGGSAGIGSMQTTSSGTAL